MGAVNSVTSLNDQPYEARYQGGSRHWHYSGGEDKTTDHVITNAFSQDVLKSQREGIDKYEIVNWGVFRAHYKINFYFADFGANVPGERVFDILVNGAPTTITVNDQETKASTGFDPYQEAGGKFKQVKVSFFADSQADSNLTISFVSHSWRPPILNAADIIALSAIGQQCEGGTGVTPVPTSVPSVTTNPDQCNCDTDAGKIARGQGDFNCDGATDLNDFTLWVLKDIDSGTFLSWSADPSVPPSALGDFNLWLAKYSNSNQ